MPTDVLPRPGFFPVRVSLNITEQDSQALDRLAVSTGEPRAVLARAAFERGLPVLVRVSLNITEQDSQALDRLAVSTGEPRAVLARAAFERGLPVLGDMYRKRRRRADPDGEDSEVRSLGGGRQQLSSGVSAPPARAG